MNSPDTPKAGTPSSRKYLESVAPVDIAGITGILPNISRVIRSTGAMSSGNKGEGGENHKPQQPPDDTRALWQHSRRSEAVPTAAPGRNSASDGAALALCYERGRVLARADQPAHVTLEVELPGPALAAVAGYRVERVLD